MSKVDLMNTEQVKEFGTNFVNGIVTILSQLKLIIQGHYNDMYVHYLIFICITKLSLPFLLQLDIDYITARAAKLDW